MITSGYRQALALFLLSGATSLVYEVLWMKRLSLIFGHTIFSVATVLSVFMAGLALGSYTGGRWADRQKAQGREAGKLIKTYGNLELAIGLWALLSLLLFNLVEQAYLALSGAGWDTTFLRAFIFVGSFLTLLAPTTAMGATLPIFTRAVVGSQLEVGALLSRIYGFNTLGACLGAALGGLLLLPSLGLRWSILVTALLNVAIAGLAHRLALSGWSVSPGAETGTSTELDPVKRASNGWRGWLLPLTFAVSGFTGMAYQLVWTRVLILSLGSSTYVFSLILVAFLASLGTGSLIYRWLFAKRSPDTDTFAKLHLLIGISAFVSTYAMTLLPDFKVWVRPLLGTSFAKVVVVDLLSVGLLMAVPTLMMGLAFPLVTHIYATHLDELGTKLGQAYSANTAGAILGSFTVGFFIIPSLGLQHTIQLVVGLNLMAGFLLSVAEKRVVAIDWGLIAVGISGLLFFPAWNVNRLNSGAYYAPEFIERKPVFVSDGATCTVTVTLDRGIYPSLAVNGKFDASISDSFPIPNKDSFTQLLLGLIPLAAHPQPKSVAVIGLGSGQTVAGLLSDPQISRVVCAELEESVVEAEKFFHSFNQNLLDDPRLTLRLDDGRSFILGSPEKFDIIVSEPSNPWIAGVGNLFTRDFYQGCRAKLNQGGLMCQWFHLYAMSKKDLEIVLTTFFSVFPEGKVYVMNSVDICLVGGEQTHEFTDSRLQYLWKNQQTAFWLHSLDLFMPSTLYGTFLAERQAVLEWMATDPDYQPNLVNTDDRPILEFRAPLSLARQDMTAGVFPFVFPQIVPDRALGDEKKLEGALLGRMSLGLIKDRLDGWLTFLFQDRPLPALLVDLKDWPSPDIVKRLAGGELGPPEESLALAEVLNRRLPEPSMLTEVYDELLRSPAPGAEYHLSYRAGRLALAEGQLERARELFTRAEPLTKTSMAVALRSTLGPVAEWSESGLSEALRRNRYDGSSHYCLALLMAEKGNIAAARMHAQEAFRLWPDERVQQLLDSLGR